MRLYQLFAVALIIAGMAAAAHGSPPKVRDLPRPVAHLPTSRLAPCDLTEHPTRSAELHVVQVKAAPGGSVAVGVTATKAPAVLLLASEQPVRWRVLAAHGARLQRVIMVGKSSSVAGLAPATKVSICGTSAGLAPFRVETVDRVADALKLSIVAFDRNSTARAGGYTVRSRRYPNLDPRNRFDQCRVDFDYAGLGITRSDAATEQDCRTLCDKSGAANRWQGRTVCVFKGVLLQTYAPTGDLERRSCRFLTTAGRNIRSYPARTESECRETICYTGAHLWQRDADKRGSQCRYRGRLIERNGKQ